MVNDNLRREQERVLLGQMPLTAVANILTAAVVVLSVNAVVSTPALLAWCAALACVLLARHLLYDAWKYGRAWSTGRRIDWLHWYRILIFITGVLWGATIFVFASTDFYGSVRWALLIIAILGLSTGALSLLAIDRISSLAYLVPMNLPLCIWLLTRGDAQAAGFGILLVLFVVYIASSAARIRVVIHENIELLATADRREQILRENEERLRSHATALEASRNESEEVRHEAERANAAKSEFLSRMSHELRTPLNAILGFAQLLTVPGRERLTERQADHVSEIRQAGEHLLGLVNEVLDLARIESGRLELHPEVLPLAELVKNCVAQVKPLAEAANIGIEIRITADCQAWGDATRTMQVLLNLLSNAIKYNRKEGGVAVEAKRQGEAWRIEVADTGRGIAADKLGSLFKSFERLESSYDGIEGTGIGLALVKKLVEAMNGTLGVESEEGRGSVFWFTLPAGHMN